MIIVQIRWEIRQKGDIPKWLHPAQINDDTEATCGHVTASLSAHYQFVTIIFITIIIITNNSLVSSEQ